MRRISWLGAAIAGCAFALAPVALAQTQDRDPNVPADRVERTDSSPSAAQNDPDRGAYDPARVGTMTRSNADVNNHRNPTSRPDVIITTSDMPAVEAAPPAPEPAAVQAPPEPYTPPTYEAPAPELPPVLPRTASNMPLAGLAGVVALGAALAVRSRRLR